MPPSGTVAYYPAFPPAIRLDGAGCIRVTHPCATLNPPKGVLPSDLHVLGLPLAFILSQDQTLHCSIVVLFFFPVLGLRYDLCSLPTRRASRRNRRTLASFCWLQAFKELSAPSSLLPLPQGRKRLQNYSFFPYAQAFSQLFFIYFQIIFLRPDCQRHTKAKKRDGAPRRLYESLYNIMCDYSLVSSVGASAGASTGASTGASALGADFLERRVVFALAGFLASAV